MKIRRMAEKIYRAIADVSGPTDKEKELGSMGVKFGYLAGVVELLGLDRGSGCQFWEQDFAVFLQIQKLAFSHLLSFQPSSLNSAQSSPPTLLGSPLFQ